MTRDPAQTVVILPAERAVRIDGETRQIGARAFDVLAYLEAHSGRVVTKAELLEHAWADLNVEESNLTVQIATLRKLIGARAIATVPGVGYQLTLAATSPADPAKALPLPDKPSLAVLPFANLTGDAGKDYLAAAAARSACHPAGPCVEPEFQPCAECPRLGAQLSWRQRSGHRPFHPRDPDQSVGPDHRAGALWAGGHPVASEAA